MADAASTDPPHKPRIASHPPLQSSSTDVAHTSKATAPYLNSSLQAGSYHPPLKSSSQSPGPAAGRLHPAPASAAPLRGTRADVQRIRCRCRRVTSRVASQAARHAHRQQQRSPFAAKHIRCSQHRMQPARPALQHGWTSAVALPLLAMLSTASGHTGCHWHPPVWKALVFCRWSSSRPGVATSTVTPCEAKFIAKWLSSRSSATKSEHREINYHTSIAPKSPPPAGRRMQADAAERLHLPRTLAHSVQLKRRRTLRRRAFSLPRSSPPWMAPPT